MKPIMLLFVLTASLALALSAHAQAGQCATGAGLEFNTFVCITPTSSSTCTVGMPMGPSYTVLSEGQVVCCGSAQVSFFYGGAQTCQEIARVFRDPGLLQAAVHAQLETGEQFLIADCQGNLVPFEPLQQLSIATRVAPIALN